MRRARASRRSPPGGGTLRRTLAAAVPVLLSGTLACGEAGTGPPVRADTGLELSFTGLRPLDPATEGTYEAWVVDSEGALHSAGRFSPANGRAVVTSPIANPVELVVTVEPPGDDDRLPSIHTLLGGPFENGAAELDVVWYLTPAVPLEEEPGTHVLFTPSDNQELGYPSFEDAGIWLFNIKEEITKQNSFFVHFTPLNEGWIYEGWIVKDHGSPEACWISYGKFEVNSFKEAGARDDTGLGPYSGQLEFRTAMEEEIYFPGDDWLANPHGFPVPCGLELPLDLNGQPHLGIPSPWTHVITVEPTFDRGEVTWDARPFVVQPYRNPFGEGPPEEPRIIEFVPEAVTGGTARLVGG